MMLEEKSKSRSSTYYSGLAAGLIAGVVLFWFTMQMLIAAR